VWGAGFGRRLFTIARSDQGRGKALPMIRTHLAKGFLWTGPRIDAAQLSCSASRWMLGACAAAFFLAVAEPSTLAQQTQPKSTQAPKTGQAAPADGAAASRQSSEDAWVKLCMKSEETDDKEICLINHEGLEPNTGMVLVAAAVRKMEGEESQQLLIRIPTAYSLVIPAGVQIRIDEAQPIQLQYSICFPTSCQVQMELTDELYQSLRKGNEMVVAGMNMQEKTMGFPVPLTGFSKADDGPPVDNAKYEEQRRQLMETFRERQAKQNMGAAGGAPAQVSPAPGAMQQPPPAANQ
jgi:invasion protein IalB